MAVLQLLLTLLLPLLASTSPVTTTPPLGNDVCLDESSLPAVSTSLNANAPLMNSESTREKKDLPVFFFHGVTGNRGNAANIEANLTAEGRPFVALSFCENECSVQALSLQVPMAIAAVRDVVARDERFKDGYIFIAHSQGGMIARAVIEQMDDHKVHKFVSLAGVQNGIFYGPQEDDRKTVQDLTTGFGAAILPSVLFDFGSYSGEASRGKMQHDWARRSADHELQVTYSMVNLGRTPVRDVFLGTNLWLPMINNLNKCAWFDFHCHMEKLRRKNNFLKLKEAHFFASPDDGIISPWQISVFGHYKDVEALEEIESDFESMTVLEMQDTVEYKEDTFGLRILDRRGGLFRSSPENVHHMCWLFDYPNPNGEGNMCEFQAVYDEFVYKVIS